MKKLIIFLILFLFPIGAEAYSSSASSAILMDMDSKRIIYAKDIYKVQSVASISKIMTAIVAIENGDLDKEITIGDEILKAYGSGIYIKQGEKIKLEDLLYGLMLRSGNDAALAIAVAVAGDIDSFVEMMNKTALEIGMTYTKFNNPSGLDEEEGNYSCAYDMALLMSYAMENEEFKKITGTKVYKVKTNKNVYEWRNKNKLLFSYKYITGGKTGFTEIAKRTLVTSASKDGLNLTVVTLNDGDDWNDHKALYEEAFKNYSNYLILEKGNLSIIGEDYYDGEDLYIKEDLIYPLLETELNSVKIKYELSKKRKINDGDVVGKVKFYIGDKEVKREDIYVKKRESEEIGFWQKIISWFKND